MKTTGMPEPCAPSTARDGAALNAGPALDESMRALRAQARTAVQQPAEDATQVARSSADAARQRALSLRDAGSEFIRERPLQAVATAAGAGALLMLLAGPLRQRGGTSR